MTIDEAYRYTRTLANKAQKGFASPDEWNLYARQAQLEVANSYARDAAQYKAGFPETPESFARQQQIKDYLRPLATTLPMTLVAGATTTPFPTDYLRKTSLKVTATGVNVDELADDEYDKRANSSLLAPSLAYPICKMQAGLIIALPVTLTGITLNYWRKPVDPVWAYTLVEDEPVYTSAGSQDFELSPESHNEICYRILQKIGVNLSQDALFQQAAVLNQQAK